MTLNKQKFRYISVYFPDYSSFGSEYFFKEFSSKYVELFGSIEFSNSLCRIIKNREPINDLLILKCKLDSVASALVSLYLLNHKSIVVSISGTIRQVKKKSHIFRSNFCESSLSSTKL
ncbi:Rpp14/Pop5 family protein [Candidatus Nitrosocosmicus franklandus]|uniref:Rpp14/Pop5 family protein n=1 Tax=Candidatus Nitrosocosmicus franklandianus TaxID=1798806 RepID=UPI00106AE0A4|nr:Rpp14/Pop5 family protein [Candidatus Nitrosocosmicus franklandus]